MVGTEKLIHYFPKRHTAILREGGTGRACLLSTRHFEGTLIRSLCARPTDMQIAARLARPQDADRMRLTIGHCTERHSD